MCTPNINKNALKACLIDFWTKLLWRNSYPLKIGMNWQGYTNCSQTKNKKRIWLLTWLTYSTLWYFFSPDVKHFQMLIFIQRFNFLGPNFLGFEIFSGQKFSEVNIFRSHIFWGQHFSGVNFFSGQIFEVVKSFQSSKISEVKFCRPENCLQ